MKSHIGDNRRGKPDIYRKKIFILFIILLIVLIIIAGCGQLAPEKADNKTRAQEQAEDKGTELPPPPPPEIVNPKLDSALNQLILADRRGEAEAFARQRDFKLMDGKVRVEIESLPGQVEAAAKAAAALGTVERVSRRWVNVVVPITSLEALANGESVRFIHLLPGGPPVLEPNTGSVND